MDLLCGSNIQDICDVCDIPAPKARHSQYWSHPRATFEGSFVIINQLGHNSWKAKLGRKQISRARGQAEATNFCPLWFITLVLWCPGSILSPQLPWQGSWQRCSCSWTALPVVESQAKQKYANIHMSYDSIRAAVKTHDWKMIHQPHSATCIPYHCIYKKCSRRISFKCLLFYSSTFRSNDGCPNPSHSETARCRSNLMRPSLLFHTCHPFVNDQLIAIGRAEWPSIAHECSRNQAIAEQIFLPQRCKTIPKDLLMTHKYIINNKGFLTSIK